jgi:hypothetical protein
VYVLGTFVLHMYSTGQLGLLIAGVLAAPITYLVWPFYLSAHGIVVLVGSWVLYVLSNFVGGGLGTTVDSWMGWPHDR